MGRAPTEVQRAVFLALGDRRSLVVIAPTGSGKTAAVMLPLLAEIDAAPAAARTTVRVLYVAPVRALVTNHTDGISSLALAMHAEVRVAARTGDTPSHVRARLVRQPPDVLVVTPESLAVILATESREMLSGLTDVVLDEVHQLASGKRGALFSATLATLDDHLRARGRPAARRLALSATVEPREMLAQWVSPVAQTVVAGGGVEADIALAEAEFDGAFPTAGWSLRRALPVVARRVASGDDATLVFVGSRARAEQWAMALRDVLPARIGVACFHGSLSAEARAEVSEGIRRGDVRCVVSTSALETGVDLPSVREVVVLSAPASVTRLTQAAGRAEHRPGAAPRARVVPTSAVDLVRSAAVLRARRAGRSEPISLREDDLDVAIQAALGRVALGPCTRDEIGDCLRRAWPFRALGEDDLDRVLGFLTSGGTAFAAYPEMARVVTDGSLYALASKRSSRRYLMAIGTIVGDVTVVVRHGTHPVGELEGRYAAMLTPGDAFVLGARTWRVVSQSAGEVHVRPERSAKRAVPQWGGSREARSELVCRAIETLWGELDRAMALPREQATAGVCALLGAGEANGEMVARLLRAQRRASVVPSRERFAVECIRDGARVHVVAFTFAGSMANEVIARVAAVRAREETGLGAEVSAHDEALGLTFTRRHWIPEEASLRAWFSPDGLADALTHALEGSVLSAAYFREVARVSQLWTPDARKGSVTPGLLFDVLRKFDPGHVLMDALKLTLWSELGGPRAEDALRERTTRRWVISTLDRPSPLAVPVLAWGARDAVAPADPEAALAAAAHALYALATEGDADD